MRFGMEAVKVSGENPILIDQYLADAIEVDVDCIADEDGEVYVAGVMEHIEEAGIHSGDSACSLPPYSLLAGHHHRAEGRDRGHGPGAEGPRADERAVRGQGRRDLRARGQSPRVPHRALRRQGDRRAGRQDRRPGHGRARGSPTFDLDDSAINRHVAVKEAVFPFNRFPNVDVILGPEMKSTGEVMGLDCQLRARLRQGPARRRGEAAAGRHGLPLGQGQRQGGRRGAGPPADRHGLHRAGDPRHRGAHPRRRPGRARW